MKYLINCLIIVASCLFGVLIGLSVVKQKHFLFQTDNDIKKYSVKLDLEDQDTLFALHIISQSDKEYSWVIADKDTNVVSKSVSIADEERFQNISLVTENTKANIVVKTVDTIDNAKPKNPIGLAIIRNKSNTVLVKKQKYYNVPKWIVSLHEFAHVAGLNHSKDVCSVMYPTLGGCMEEYSKLLVQHDLNISCIWNKHEMKFWGFTEEDIAKCREIWNLKDILRKAYTTKDLPTISHAAK